MSITRKFSILITILTFIPLALMSMITINASRHSLTNQILSHLESVADIQTSRVESVLDRYIEWATLITSRTRLRQDLATYTAEPDEALVENMDQILLDALRSTPQIHSIALYDTDGFLVTSTDDSLDLIADYIGDRELFQRGITEAYIFGLSKNSSNKLEVITVSPLVLDGTTIGVALLYASSDPIINITDDYTGLGSTGEVILATNNNNGDALFLTPLRFNASASLNLAIPKNRKNSPMLSAVQGEERTFLHGTDYRDTDVIAVSQHIRAIDWGLVAKMDRDEAFEQLDTLQKTLTLLSVIVLITTALLSLQIAGLITHPIKILDSEITNLTKQRFDTNISEDLILKRNELGSLARSFKQMTMELKQLYTNLETQVAQRTKELNEKLRETEKLNRVMVGRELKMIELKKAIEDLKRKAQARKPIPDTKKKNKHD